MTTRTLTAGTVATVVALAMVAGAVAAVPAGVAASSTSPASVAGNEASVVGFGVAAQQNNSSSMNTTTSVTSGFVNNSTLNGMSKSQLIQRVNSLQTVLTQTQSQYLKTFRELQLQLNKAQGVETNVSNTPMNSTANTTPAINNSTLNEMSKSDLVSTVNSYQNAITQTQTQYLRTFRELQTQLDERQASDSNGTQLPNVTQKVNTTNGSNADNQTNTTEHTRNVTNATNGSSAMNATNATTMANMSNATSATSSMATNASTTNAAGGSTTGTGSAGGSTSGGGGGGNSSTTSSSNGPGFGVLVAVVGLLAAAGIALRRN